MEKAIALTPPQLRRIKPEALRGCDIVYLGSEFCQNLLPTAEDMVFAAEKFKKRVVLSTSLMTGEKLAECERLIKKLLRRGRPAVSVNDMGLLYLLDEKYKGRAEISLGRLVTTDFIRLYKPYASHFCRSYGVKMMETDEEEMLESCLPDGGCAVAFHYPLRLASMTRFCPFAEGKSGSCGHACDGKTIRLRSPKLRESCLVLKNNAYFFPGKISRSKIISRLIYTPPDL